MTTSTATHKPLQPSHRSATQSSPLTLARLAGVLYIIITIAAIVAHFYVPSTFIVPDDAAATVANIQADQSLFRIGGIGSELIILLSEVVLSIILYYLLRPVNKTLSLLAAVSRLVMTTIHGLNLLNYFFIIIVLGDPAFLTAFGAEQVQALVSLFLEAHTYGFAIGIAFLVLHVFALGYLIYRSGYIPRVLGVLFLIAGMGYLFDSIGLLLIASYQIPDFIAAPIAIAEIAFPIWLLVKGVNRERFQERVTELPPVSRTQKIG